MGKSKQSKFQSKEDQEQVKERLLHGKAKNLQRQALETANIIMHPESLTRNEGTMILCFFSRSHFHQTGEESTELGGNSGVEAEVARPTQVMANKCGNVFLFIMRLGQLLRHIKKQGNH